MRSIRTSLMAVMAVAATSLPALADYLVREVGSFHVGGRTATVSGMPTRDVVFSPRAADQSRSERRVCGRADVRAVRQACAAEGKGPDPAVARRRAQRRHLGDQARRQARLAAVLPQHGYDVYVSDAVERGRASWARYPEIFKSEPMFRTKKEAWELFRIGPSYEVGGQRVAFEGQQFPIETFDQFAMQGVPRWVTDAATQKAYDALVEKVCPCIVVVHSQGGSFGFNGGACAPDKIKALVAIEPSGAPDPAAVDAGKSGGLFRISSCGAISATRSRSGSGCRSLPPNIAMPSSPEARPSPRSPGHGHQGHAHADDGSQLDEVARRSTIGSSSSGG